MKNGENSTAEQKNNIQKEPIKEPQTETAHIPPNQVEKASHEKSTTSSSDFKTQSGIDVENDNSMDSTVNTDGKMNDAKNGTTPDSTIYSNATTVDNVDTPAEGLAGIDSRIGNNQFREIGITETPENKKNNIEHQPLNHAQVGKIVEIDTST